MENFFSWIGYHNFMNKLISVHSQDGMPMPTNLGIQPVQKGDNKVLVPGVFVVNVVHMLISMDGVVSWMKCHASESKMAKPLRDFAKKSYPMETFERSWTRVGSILRVEPTLINDQVMATHLATIGYYGKGVIKLMTKSPVLIAEAKAVSRNLGENYICYNCFGPLEFTGHKICCLGCGSLQLPFVTQNVRKTKRPMEKVIQFIKGNMLTFYDP